MTIAIIGTAGRDKSKVMDRKTWDAMLSDARSRVSPSDVLVSGGAAWSDHLAVALFLSGAVSELHLHFPAPLGPKVFEGGFGTSGGAANYYHRLFSMAIEEDTLEQLREAIRKGASVTSEPVCQGYGAMMVRNKKVANEASGASGGVIAYTYGKGKVPADGGTRHTWDICETPNKTHVPIEGLQ